MNQPCRDVRCSEEGAVCRVSASGPRRQAQCSCGGGCRGPPQPVCGSDGRSHASDCHLRLAACRQGLTLTILYRGGCHTGVNPCAAAACRAAGPGAGAGGWPRCLVSPSSGEARCLCPPACPAAAAPVCGSDGRSYQTLCHLRRDACLRRDPALHVLHAGAPCGAAEKCACSGGEVCVLRAGRSVCECPECPASGGDADVDDAEGGRGEEVCGSDGRRYASPCLLRRAACLAGNTLTQAAPDVCRTAGDSGLRPTENAGQLRHCECDSRGSVSDSCDPTTGQCVCKRGFTGFKCEQCQPDFWESRGARDGVDACEGGFQDRDPPEAVVKQARKGSKSPRHLLPRGHKRSRQPSEPEREPGFMADQAVQDLGYRRSEAVRAPPQVVSARVAGAALVGEPCAADADCASPHSACSQGACACADGYTRATDALCIPEDIPAFDGNSYMRLKALEAYNKLSIEVEFKTYESNGIILYTQQEDDGTGDYVSLAVVNGRVQFRLNVGNGPLVLESGERVSDGAWHRAVAVYGNAGASSGLVGCVRALRVGGLRVALSGAAARRAAVAVRRCPPCLAGDPRCLRPPGCLRNLTTGGSCSSSRFDPCASSPCVGGSTCEPLAGGGFFCNCSRGAACDTEGSTFVAALDGSSSLELAWPEGAGAALSLDLWFLAEQPDGVLLSAGGGGRAGGGDFLWLALVGGRLQLRFNLGSGAATVTSPQRAEVGRWQRALVSRAGRKAWLRLGEEGGLLAAGEAPPPLARLDLRSPLLLGAPRGEGVPAAAGLRGAVQRLSVNGRLLELGTAAAQASPSVPPWRGPLCAHPHCLPRCQLGGRCSQGDRNDSISERPVKFTGSSFFRLPNKVIKRKKTEQANRYEIVFRTMELNGLLLWLSKGRTATNHFSLAVVNGQVEMSFGLGRRHKPLLIRSQVWVSDGAWHRVVALRHRWRAALRVDAGAPGRGAAAGGAAATLRSNGWLCIGGARSLPPGLPMSYYVGFKGCIRELLVSRKQLSVLERVDEHKNFIEYCHENEV
ncbi:agrin-like [Schistocerca piceifrons]|uniref:agrin-like n=1 Tax=Schistocerca piceifrons TaxID=274613 RepID=UPI001F5EC33B|nr:agrin-like [Schistocerca piceifrons]